MKVSGLDNKGDWIFGKHNSSYRKGDRAIGQNVTTRLKSFKNDWYLDEEAGLPYFRLLSDKNTKTEIDFLVKDTIEKTWGVVKVLKMESLPDTKKRSLKINASILTIYGSVFELLNIGVEI